MYFKYFLNKHFQKLFFFPHWQSAWPYPSTPGCEFVAIGYFSGGWSLITLAFTPHFSITIRFLYILRLLMALLCHNTLQLETSPSRHSILFPSNFNRDDKRRERKSFLIRKDSKLPFLNYNVTTLVTHEIMHLTQVQCKYMELLCKEHQLYLKRIMIKNNNRNDGWTVLIISTIMFTQRSLL